MINYGKFVEVYKKHYKEKHLEKKEEYVKDASCIVCYPVEKYD